MHLLLLLSLLLPVSTSPTPTKSTAFRLVVPTHNLILSGLHSAGAFTFRAILLPYAADPSTHDPDEYLLSPIFYQNGTEETKTIIHDILPEGFPQTLQLIDPAASSDVVIPELMPQLHISVSRRPPFFVENRIAISTEQEPRLVYGDGGRSGGGWYMCEQPAGLRNEVHSVVNYGMQGRMERGCVEIEIVPECAELLALPQGALGSHESVAEVACYEDMMDEE